MQTTDTYFLPNQQILIKANLAHADTSLSTVSCNRPFIFEGEKTFSWQQVMFPALQYTR